MSALIQAMVFGAMAFSAGMLVFTLSGAKKEIPIRPRFDIVRVVLGIGSALVMGVIVSVQTPGWLALLAILAGVALGYFQGGSLQVAWKEGSAFARRTFIGIILWGAGMIIMQAAGFVSRAGVFRFGQATAFFSISMTIGLMIGRRRPMDLARQTSMAVQVFLVVAVLALGVAPVLAQSDVDAELCDFTPSDGYWSQGPFVVDQGMSILGITPFEVSIPTAKAACSNTYEHFDGTTVEVAVYLMGSDSEAQAALREVREAALATANEVDFSAPALAGLGDDAWLASFDFDQIAFTQVGSYIVAGHSIEAYDYSREEYTGILGERMGEIVTKLGGPQSSVTGSGTPTTDNSGNQAPSGGFGQGDIGEGEALASAAAAGVAVVVMSGLTLAEGGQTISDVVGSRRGAGPPPGEEAGAVADQADTEGDSGRWVYFPGDDRPEITKVQDGPPGKVLVDGEWVDVDQLKGQNALDQDWLEARRKGQELINRFAEIEARLKEATDPALRAQLEAELRQAAVEINADQAAKMALKQQGRNDLTRAVDSAVERIYGEVDPGVIRGMNDIGLSRGGREFRGHDLYDIRNASSAGTVGADRDVALNEARMRELESRLAAAEKGSQEANRLLTELNQARAANRVAVDYDKLIDHLRTQIASEPAGTSRAGYLQQLLDASTQHAAASKTAYLSELDQRIASAPEGSSQRAALMAERAAAETRVAGSAETTISTSRWNDIAKDVYNQEYQRVTGTNADQAYQALTQKFNPEAYRDLGVLTGDPSKFDAASAEQTASVSRYKTFHNDHMAEEGHITRGHAIQEDARGYAKDMMTKTLPTLRNDPRVDPQKLAQLNKIQNVLDRVGKGQILPSQIDAELQKALPEVQGMNMDKAKTMADTALEAAIKSTTKGELAGPSRIQGAFGKTSDLATIDGYARQHMANGMNQAEATALATAQTLGGNAAMATGITDPRMSMAGGALLPNGMSNMLPDQAVENVVGTTYQGTRAAVESLHDSFTAGELKTEALDRFVDSIDERPGVDPYKGIARAADLLGEEVGRAGGESVVETTRNMARNLGNDLSRIYETGAGSEVLNEGMNDFQQRVASGEYTAPLEGIDHLARMASDTLVDPGGTVGQFAEDVSTMWEHGVGEGYWDEVVSNTDAALQRTPLLGQVVNGYKEIASGVGGSGVTGFGQEMAEGAYHLAEETASRTVDYLRSFW